MILDIRPVELDSTGCIEQQITSLTSWLGIGNELMHLGAWSFAFDISNYEQEGVIGDRIGVRKGYMLYFLEKYHGIKYVYQRDASHEECLTTLKKELSEGRPILIFFDCFWYPWSQLYQNKHALHPHTFLAVGIDETGKGIYCTDAYYMRDRVLLPMEDFVRGYVSYAAFTFMNIDIHKQNWKSAIGFSIDRILDNGEGISAFDEMRALADTIEHHLSMQSEALGYEDAWETMPIIRNLNEIKECRKRFGRVLAYIARVFEIDAVSEVSAGFFQSADQWGVILSLLVKMLYAGSTASLRAKAASKVRAAAELEEGLAARLIEICGLDEASKKAGMSEVVFLDITKHLNNKDFDNIILNKPTEALTKQEYHIADQPIPSGRVWKIKDMKFSMPEYDCNDSISCMGQTLKLSPGEYSSIMLLGFGVEAGYSERISLCCKNGGILEIPLEFSDCFGVSEYEDGIAWEGQGVHKGSSSERSDICPVKIYTQLYPILCDEEIVGIKLPNCPDIHILAISLKK